MSNIKSNIVFCSDYEPPDVKRGSTASLSKLEDDHYMSDDYLRPTMSSSMYETSSVRSAPSVTGSPISRPRSQLNSPSEEKTSPPFKYNTMPTPKKADKKAKGKAKQDGAKQVGFTIIEFMVLTYSWLKVQKSPN